MPNSTILTGLLAEQLMTAEQIAWMLALLGLIVCCIYVFGFLGFVKWGNKMGGDKRAREIELALLERERENKTVPKDDSTS